MKELGFKVVIEEGETGQFELFKEVMVQKTKHMSTTEWVSYMKKGQGTNEKIFTLRDFDLKLSGITPE